MDSIYVLLGFFTGWFVAQATKLVIALVASKEQMSLGDAMKIVMKSGGMPSGHTASFTSTTMMIGYACGFNSAIFALAVCVTIILVYDATNVRYAVGLHGKVINQLMKKEEIELKGKKSLRVVEGHTLLQVLVGFLIGMATSFILAVALGLVKL